jgi:SAM-dependent methyltransferase
MAGRYTSAAAFAIDQEPSLFAAYEQLSPRQKWDTIHQVNVPQFFSPALNKDLIFGGLSGRVLELLCGNESLLYKRPNVHAVGVDWSAAAISIYSFTGTGVVADVNTSLPFADHSFDGATIIFGLNYVRDQQTFFRDVARVLKPEGTLVLFHGYDSGWSDLETQPYNDSVLYAQLCAAGFQYSGRTLFYERPQADVIPGKYEFVSACAPKR